MFESFKSHSTSINFEYLFSAGGGPVKNRLNAPSSNWSRISAFHAGDTGSNPVTHTKLNETKLNETKLNKKLKFDNLFLYLIYKMIIIII